MSPLERQALLIAVVVWHVGWLAYGILFTRQWLRRRKEDPEYTPPFFPWDRVLIAGLLLWWLYFCVDLVDWLRRRRKGP